MLRDELERRGCLARRDRVRRQRHQRRRVPRPRSGWPSCPADAWAEVVPLAGIVLTRAGGHGCVREFCDAVWSAKRAAARHERSAVRSRGSRRRRHRRDGAARARCTSPVSPSAGCASPSFDVADGAAAGRRPRVPRSTSPTARRSRRALDEVVGRVGRARTSSSTTPRSTRRRTRRPRRSGRSRTYPEASFDAVMDVNVKGTFLCCQVVGARDGARGARLDRQRLVRLRAPLARCRSCTSSAARAARRSSSPSRTRSRSRRVLNLTRYLATYWATAGVRVNTLTLAGVWNEQAQEFLDACGARVADGAHARGAARRSGAVVFLASDASSYVTGLEPRRRRRLVGLVALPGRSRTSSTGVRSPARDRRLARQAAARPTRRFSAASRARERRTSTTRSRPRARRSRPGPSARRSPVATSSASSRSLLRERREEASALVVEETGKPEELALGETDAAVEMGLFIAGRGPPLVRPDDDGEHGAPHGADAAAATRRRCARS